MTVLDFICLTLAAGAVVNAWFNGSIFAEWRVFANEKAYPTEADDAADFSPLAESPPEEPLPWLMQLASRFVPPLLFELLTCPFCFSHHTPWLLALVFFLPAYFLVTPWCIFLCKLPVYSLAATQLGNLINAVSPAGTRYQQ